jgi:SnoaL-like domain
MVDDARKVVEGYFTAWKQKDFATMRSLLDDKASFAGPIDRFDNADALQRSIEGLSEMMTDLVIHKTFVDGQDVLSWYDLHTGRRSPPISLEPAPRWVYEGT